MSHQVAGHTHLFLFHFYSLAVQKANVLTVRVSISQGPTVFTEDGVIKVMGSFKGDKGADMSRDQQQRVAVPNPGSIGPNWEVYRVNHQQL